MHNGFVNIDNEKMSKSLNNFLMIKDILQSYHPETVRLFLLSSHYRSPIDFSDQNLKESEKALDKIYGVLKRLDQEAGLPTQTMQRPAATTGRTSVKPWTMTSTRPKVSAFCLTW
jgi:cysteinyl-tRNA synthetase